MDLILVRYAEVGLKSRAVRSRFERILMDNMMSILAREGTEAIIKCDQGRIFVQTSDIDKAIPVLQRVFGLASVSPVLQMGSAMPTMRQTVAEYSKKIMLPGETFKIEARRTGNHTYTSMEAGRDIGEEVIWANEDRGVKVNLHHPSRVIYVEIRDNLAYAFSEYMEGPGGLPMGSQGKVLALLEKESDALAAWLIMKRGCKCIGIGKEGPAVDILRRWDPDMKLVDNLDIEFMVKRHNAVAVVFGYGVDDMDKIRQVKLTVPAFYPTIGWNDEQVRLGTGSIKEGRSARFTLAGT
jgi:thiamine biosynthesis protein ThiI